MKLLFSLLLCVGLVAAGDVFGDDLDWPSYSVHSFQDVDDVGDTFLLSAGTATEETVHQISVEGTVSTSTTSLCDVEDEFVDACAEVLNIEASRISLFVDGMTCEEWYNSDSTGGTGAGTGAARRLLDESSTDFSVLIDDVSTDEIDSLSTAVEDNLADGTIIDVVAESVASFSTVDVVVTAVEDNESIDCVGSWSEGDCSVTCGSGTQSNTYEVSVDAAYGGEECDYDDGDVQTDACDEDACSDLIQNGDDSDDLSDGEIAAIVLCVILFVVIVCLIIYWCMKRRVVLDKDGDAEAVPTGDAEAVPTGDAAAVPTGYAAAVPTGYAAAVPTREPNLSTV